MPSTSPHVRSLTAAEAQHEGELGSVRRLTDFLVFFDQPAPGDIGYRASASALSPPALGSTRRNPADPRS